MKDFLISILILLVLVAAFATVESRIEFEYPFGNWAVPGDGGQPVPGDGEPGKVNTFSFGSAEQADTTGTQDGTEDFCPITVEVVTEQTEEQPKEQIPVWVFIIGAILAVVYVFAVWAYVEYFKERKECRSTALLGGAFYMAQCPSG